jgi:uncharacterized protein (TIGR00255 family)
MVKSMTAYGRGEYQQGDTLFIAEIRSYNNRYRDIILRIPKNFQGLDDELKSIISSRIRRGRLEVSIQIENNSEDSPYNLELNLPLVNSYFEIFNKLSEQFGLDQKITIEALCQMKDVVLVKPAEVDVEAVKPGLREVLSKTLDSLEEMRSREGKAIETDFLKRLDLLEQYVDKVDNRAPSLIEEYRKKLKDNVQGMLKDVGVDENRLIQEVAFFAEKADITEEIVRVRSHLKQFREYLSLDDALGRRLDFLIQEINREVNTVGSKASDSFIGKFVVEMKAELEKLREQAQNVE